MVFNHDLYQFVQSTVSRKKEDLQEIVELETGISKAYEDSSSRLFTFKLEETYFHTGLHLNFLKLSLVEETKEDAVLKSGKFQNGIIVVVQLPCHVRLFVTPWTAACQASLSLPSPSPEVCPSSCPLHQ